MLFKWRMPIYGWVVEMESGEPKGFWKANKTRVVTVVLVISVVLNLASFAVIRPRLETTINNMMTKTFEHWLYNMFLIGSQLERAGTNFDLEDPLALASYLAHVDMETFAIGTSSRCPEEGLYASMSSTVFALCEALDEAYAGNQTGVIVKQSLDPGVVVIVRSMARTIDNLFDKTVRALALTVNGVDPVQQLSEAGVLADVEDYLGQIYQLSHELYAYEYP
jgi:hypothetical protein